MKNKTAIPNNTGRQSDGRFSPGNCANPTGRPRGSLNKATLVAQALIDGEGEEIVRKTLQLAKAGDGVALKIVMDRLIPPRKDRHLQFPLPPIVDAQSAAGAMSTLINAVGNGELSAYEADGLADLVERRAKLSELAEIEARLKALEERLQ
jgi:Family of unknown function (DUF5681)